MVWPKLKLQGSYPLNPIGCIAKALPHLRNYLDTMLNSGPNKVSRCEIGTPMQSIYANQTTCPLWSMQFHVMFSLGNCESASKHIQPGEGPNRGLLCDCEIFAKVRLKLYWTMLACWCRVNRSCHKCPSRRRRGPSCTSPSWCDAAAPQLFLPVTIRAAARQFLHLYKATQIFTVGTYLFTHFAEYVCAGYWKWNRTQTCDSDIRQTVLCVYL